MAGSISQWTMCPGDPAADVEALFAIQAKCREWAEVTESNRWRPDDWDAARRLKAAHWPKAKALEAATMSLIRKHESLLTWCRTRFVAVPSTALDRAFDYIGIYLHQSPEKLRDTVGLPGCLTVEVAQPGVVERCREPTFVVQLGRWAQELGALADQDGGGVEREGKKSRVRWGTQRAKQEVADDFDKHKPQWHHFLVGIFCGDAETAEQAAKDFRAFFRGQAIADRLGRGCYRQAVEKTPTYLDEIKPALARPPQRPKSWVPPKQDTSTVDAYRDGALRHVGVRPK